MHFIACYCFETIFCYEENAFCCRESAPGEQAEFVDEMAMHGSCDQESRRWSSSTTSRAD